MSPFSSSVGFPYTNLKINWSPSCVQSCSDESNKYISIDSSLEFIKCSTAILISDSLSWNSLVLSWTLCSRRMANAIAPAPPLSLTLRSPQLVGNAKSEHKPTLNVTFRQAFGLLGLPILFLAVVCILWTTWLIALTLDPNATANYLMGTGAYDDGTFWLIIDPKPVTRVITALSLSLVVLGYMYVLALMVILRNRKRRSIGISSVIEARLLRKHVYRRVSTLWVETTSFHGRYRKYWVRFFSYLSRQIERELTCYN